MTRDGLYFSKRSVTRPFSLRFFPSPGPLPHRIRLRTNQQPPLTSILLVLTCEPVTLGNLKGEYTESLTSRIRKEENVCFFKKSRFILLSLPSKGFFVCFLIIIGQLINLNPLISVFQIPQCKSARTLYVCKIINIGKCKTRECNTSVIKFLITYC